MSSLHSSSIFEEGLTSSHPRQYYGDPGNISRGSQSHGLRISEWEKVERSRDGGMDELSKALGPFSYLLRKDDVTQYHQQVPFSSQVFHANHQINTPVQNSDLHSPTLQARSANYYSYQFHGGATMYINDLSNNVTSEGEWTNQPMLNNGMTYQVDSANHYPSMHNSGLSNLMSSDQVIHQLESANQQVQVPMQNHGSGVSVQHQKKGDNQNKRVKGKAWTIEEHIEFLHGLNKYGKGEWKKIAAVVGQRTGTRRNHTQTASHAQKYFKRQIMTSEEKKKKSIHDITLEMIINMSREEIEGLIQHYNSRGIKCDK